MLSARQRILALVLGGIGALAWWLYQDKETPMPERNDQARRPDYSVDNLTATIMDESGTPHRHLTAAALYHYADDDSSEVEGLGLTLFQESGPPWVVTSETAWISGDRELIRLHGEVKAGREAGGGRARPVQLETRELLIRPEEDYAETDQPVRITSGLDWMTSDKGAQVWMEEKLRVKLLGPVRGELIIP